MLEAMRAANDLFARTTGAIDVKGARFRDLLEEYIREINQDQRLLQGAIEHNLAAWAEGRPATMANGQEIILGENENLLLRIHIWPNLLENDDYHRGEALLFSFVDAHDHNYDFLTIGHYGPGYENDVFLYDRDKIPLQEGDRVELEYLETFTLEKDRTFWFESGRHVHVQKFPASLSASINLVVQNDEESAKPQFCFDLPTGRVSKLVEGAVGKQVNFLRMCSLFQDDEVNDIVDFYAGKSDIPLLRHYAATLKQGALSIVG